MYWCVEQTVHEGEYNKFEEERNQPVAEKRKCADVLDARKQPRITGFFCHGTESLTVTQHRVDELVIEYIVSEMRPLSAVEKPSFVRLVQGLRPGAQVMSRKTVSKHILEDYAKMEDELKKNLAEVKYVCSTADIWSLTNRSYLGMTVHWIVQETLERKSAAVGCRRFVGMHSHDRIARHIADTSFNLDGKVLKTCTDNGANMVKAFKANAEAHAALAQVAAASTMDEYISRDLCEHDSDEEDEDSQQNAKAMSFDSLTDLFNSANVDLDLVLLPEHQHCCSHTLNLVATTDAQKALDETNGTAYKKIYREVMGKCDALWNLTSRSTKAADAAFEILGYRFCRPCVTRWNSHYDAVSLVLKAGDKLNVVCKQLGLPQFQPQHINFMREYTALMGPVAKALDVLQGEKNCYFGYVIPTIATLTEKLNAASPVLHVTHPLQVALLNGIQKRFSDYMSNPDCIMATITHPKFKLAYLPPSLHGAYILRLDQEVNAMSASVEPAASNQDDDDFFACATSSTQSNLQQHLVYLNDPSTEIHMLQNHPQVKQLFLKYNTVIPSSAPVERLFSTASLILTKHRNRLSDALFEKLLLLKANGLGARQSTT